MIEYDKIKYTELKKVVMSLNDSGVLASSVRHVAVKGPKLYDEFISAIENLSDDDQSKLPDDVIDFFNYAINEESDETEPELDFDEPITHESYPDPEPTDEVIQEEEPVPIVAEELKVVEKPEPEVTSEPEPIKEIIPGEEPVVTEEAPTQDELVEEKSKIKRLSRTPMTAKVEDGVLTIAFRELEKSKSFKLPEKENIAAFKPVREKAINFADGCGATKGQIAAVGKTLNMAGYYTR